MPAVQDGNGEKVDDRQVQVEDLEQARGQVRRLLRRALPVAGGRGLQGGQDAGGVLEHIPLGVVLRRLGHPLEGRHLGQQHGLGFVGVDAPILSSAAAEGVGARRSATKSLIVKSISWPTAEIAVMGPDGAVNIIFRKQIAEADDPEAERARLVQEYRDTFANPYVAAARGYIDDVIEPRETRPRLIEALTMLQNKRDQNPPKKHGNIPL